VQSINNNTKLLNWKSLSWQLSDIAQHQDGESLMSSRDWQPNGVDVNQPENASYTDERMKTSHVASPTEDHSSFTSGTFKYLHKQLGKQTNNSDKCSQSSNDEITASQRSNSNLLKAPIAVTSQNWNNGYLQSTHSQLRH
jgi:hypothetical protein